MSNVKRFLQSKLSLRRGSKGEITDGDRRGEVLEPKRVAMKQIPIPLVRRASKDALGEMVTVLRAMGLELPKEFVEYAPPVPLVREVQKHLVPATYDVLTWCWNHEEIIQRIVRLAQETILGAGWKVDGSDPLKTELEDLYEEVFPMSDFVECGVSNLVVLGNQLFVPAWVGGYFKGLRSVDWTTIKHRRDPIGGHEVFIQDVLVPREMIREVGENVYEPIGLNEWKKLDPVTIDVSLAQSFRVVFRMFTEDVLYLKIGSRGFVDGRALMAPVVTDIVYKKWLEFMMLRGAEIWGQPLLIGSLLSGLPPDQLKSLIQQPEQLANLQTQINDFADQLVKYRAFGVFALGPHQKLDVKFPGRGLIDWIGMFEYLNREIVGCMLGSTALFEARGAELATSRTIKSVWDQTMDGWRYRLEESLNKQFHPMYKRKTKTIGKVKFKFQRLEVPEEVIAQLMAVPREERRRVEKLAKGAG